MSQYTLIRAALEADIKAAWSGVTVSFGRPLVPFESMPRAVCSFGKVDYKKSGIRSFDKTWSGKIAASFQLSTDEGSELEPIQMTKIDLFIAQFLPETDDGSVPAVNGAYAGISNRYMITGFEAIEPDPEDQVYMITIDFEIVTEIHA